MLSMLDKPVEERPVFVTGNVALAGPVKRLPRWRLSILAQASDFIVINLAALLAFVGAGGSLTQRPLRYNIVFIVTALLCQASFAQSQLYRIDALSDSIRAIRIMFPRWLFVFTMLAACAGLTHEPGLFSRAWFGLFCLCGIVGLAVSRTLIARGINHMIRYGFYIKAVAIVGDNSIAQRLIARFAEKPSSIHFVGIFDVDAAGPNGFVCHVARLGDIDDLILYARSHPVDMVVIALPFGTGDRLMPLLRRLRDEPLNIRVLPGELGLQRVSPIRLVRDELPGVQLIALADRPISDAAFFIKNIFDRCFAGAVLVLLAPVFLICIAGISAASPGPWFFKQPRVGYKGRVFEIIKFRTMHHETCGESQPVCRKDARLFVVGKWLRCLSIDELPQLFNVLRGDMSLVGPRPHMVGQCVDGQYFADALDDYAGRHWVKPGMTGWAQVNGWRGPAVTREQIERRVEHDIYYIENWSLTFDLIILIKTIFVGFFGKNAF